MIYSQFQTDYKRQYSIYSSIAPIEKNVKSSVANVVCYTLKEEITWAGRPYRKIDVNIVQNVSRSTVSTHYIGCHALWQIER